jgi:ethanolamine utilization protein EutK
MTIRSLGFVEVKGYVSAIAVADAMVKTSNIKIMMDAKLDPGQVTIVVEGELGACEAAVSAGAEVARRFGSLVGVLVKGKPDRAIEDLVRDDGPMTDPSATAQAVRP